jgi:hypothetical protein
MNALSPVTTKKLVWLAVACVLLVNAAILGKVFYNRSDVVATLQLSERELQLPYNYGFDKEDSSKRVSLKWSTLDPEPVSLESYSWRWRHNNSLILGDAHFASFQFPACDKTNRSRYKQPAWVLLEFNGKSYADYVLQAEQYYAFAQALEPTADTELVKKDLKEKLADATEFLATAKNKSSRLFVVDAAVTRELLETRLQSYSSTDGSQLIIVPAEVQAPYNRCDASVKKTTEIMISNLAVESLYVPKDFAEKIALGDGQQSKSSFTADIYYGRLYEPWINGVRH